MRNWLVVLALAAAGYALTLYVFFPGVMTYDAKYIYLADQSRAAGRLAIAGHGRDLEMDRSARARRREHVSSDHHDLLARLSLCWRSRSRRVRWFSRRYCLSSPRCRPPSRCSASSGATSCSLRRGCSRSCWHGAARDRAAAIRIPVQIVALGLRRARNPAAAECVVRDPDSCDLYPLADGVSLEARGACLCSLGRSPSTRWCRSSITAR